MMQRRKEHDVMFKALPDADGQTGRFEALVAAFGNVDLVGDRILKGAFAKSIGRWRASGDPLPIIWSHNWGDPNAHVGFADPRLMEETDKGLKIVGQIDVDQPVAAQVYRLLKERRVRSWSFAYDIQRERPGRDRANELVELDIIEAGPTLSGANPETETIAIKSLIEDAAREAEGLKAGRVLSARNEAELRRVIEILETVLSSVAREEESEDKSRSGKNVYTHLPGSAEEARAQLDAAVRAWGADAYPKEDNEQWTYVAIVGTFEDRVVVEIQPPDSAAATYVEIPYSRDGENVTLGEPTPVEVTAEVSDAESETKSAETDEGRAEREAYKQRLEMFAVGL